MVYVIQTALELGFMYALVAMALFLSYRILCRICDSIFADQTGCSVYSGRNRYKHRSLYGEPDGHGMELQCQSLKAEYIVYHDERDRDWRRMV